MWTQSGKAGGMSYDSTGIYTSTWKTAVGSLCVTRQLSPGLCDDLDGTGWGGREAHEGGDICIHTADSLDCTAKTNTAF